MFQIGCREALGCSSSAAEGKCSGRDLVSQGTPTICLLPKRNSTRMILMHFYDHFLCLR